MPLTAGTRLGPYEIVAPLGAGGMGEVYRAKDTRLGRDVAVKVLPQHLSSSPEIRARFEREAKTVSSLNHPNICTLHDVGREGDTDYLVMELVEGETLAQRLTRGALPLSDVLRFGAQIADALDRAHRASVSHRDLKPGNVMLSKSGAKLLDFGLARATGLGPTSELTSSPTVASPLTAEGTILGTFQYMAPEQLEGAEADTRADVWAFGCVLYEMATGKRAFDGKSQASLIGSIMNAAPRAMSELAPMTPPALERVVQQCLAKEPDERWQSAGDLKRELEWIARSSSSGVAPVPGAQRPRRRPGWAMVILGAAAGIVLGALAIFFGPSTARSPEQRVVRFALGNPPDAFLGFPAEPALSPDGTTLTFATLDDRGASRLFVRPLNATEPRPLAGTESASLPFWAPDGRTIGFFANGRLMKVGLDGSAPVTLCDAPDPRGGTWSQDGVILIAPNNSGPIVRVPASGGATAPVTTMDAATHEFGHRYPQFLPDGKHFLYVAIHNSGGQSTLAASLAGGPPIEVCKAATGARYAPPGYLLYTDWTPKSSRKRLLARKFDPDSLKASGDAVLLLDDVQAENIGYPNVTADEHGSLVVQRWRPAHFLLDWRDRSGAITGVAVADIATIPGMVLSPDARRLAYAGADPLDLYVRDLESGVATRITFQNSGVQDLVWSHDGRRIAFGRQEEGTAVAIYTKNSDGSGDDTLVFRGPGLFSHPLAWSHDGRWIAAQVSDPTGAFDLWIIPMAGQGEPHLYRHTPGDEKTAAISPDGRWLAYVAIEDGKPVAYVESFPEPGTQSQITVDEPTSCWWPERGDQLLVHNRKSEVFSIPITTTPGFTQGAPIKLFTVPPPSFLVDVAADGQRFVTATFDPRSANNTLEVVLGWPSLLRRE